MRTGDGRSCESANETQELAGRGNGVADQHPGPTLVHILLVEDNPADARWCEVSFEESQLPIVLHVVNNGEDALKFLRRDKPYDTEPTPSLVLLDRSLPRISGDEVIDALRADGQLSEMPVILLTGCEPDLPLEVPSLIKPLNVKDLLKAIEGYEGLASEMLRGGAQSQPDGSAD